MKEVHRNLPVGIETNYVGFENQNDNKLEEPVAVILYFHLTLHFLNPFVQANYDFVNSYNVAVQDMMVSQFELVEPLLSCHLQIQRSKGMPSKGGYLSSFTNVFEMIMCSNNCPIVQKDNKIILMMLIIFLIQKFSWVLIYMLRKMQVLIQVLRINVKMPRISIFKVE